MRILSIPAFSDWDSLRNSADGAGVRFSCAASREPVSTNEHSVAKSVNHKNLQRLVYVYAETAGCPPADVVVDIFADRRMDLRPTEGAAAAADRFTLPDATDENPVLAQPAKPFAPFKPFTHSHFHPAPPADYAVTLPAVFSHGHLRP